MMHELCCHWKMWWKIKKLSSSLEMRGIQMGQQGHEPLLQYNLKCQKLFWYQFYTNTHTHTHTHTYTHTHTHTSYTQTHIDTNSNVATLRPDVLSSMLVFAFQIDNRVKPEPRHPPIISMQRQRKMNG